MSLTLLLAALLQVEDSPASVPPTPGDLNTCVLCHGGREFWAADPQLVAYLSGELDTEASSRIKRQLAEDEGLRGELERAQRAQRFYVPPERLASDVHFQRGVKCHQCHGGNPTSLDPAVAHARQEGAGGELPFGNMTRACGSCHETQLAGLRQGVHSGLLRAAPGAEGTMSCRTCHTDQAHQILPTSDPQSPVHLKNQIDKCVRCHSAAFEEYRHSPHGRGLFQAGLTSATCADCHGAHGIFRPSNANSMLHVAQVADTCGQCHRLIEDRLRLSVHGQGAGPGRESTIAAPGGDTMRRPSCTDCHVGHDLPNPRSANVRNQQGDRCGNCHKDLQTTYRFSMHGALSDLGYSEGAKCSDCHGSHEILPLSDKDSLMAPGNRIETCARCHQGISRNLVSFDPHANHRDKERSPLVFWVYRGVLTFIITVFGVFGTHAVLFFLRGLIDVVRHGRPRAVTPNVAGYTRFSRFHRVAHTIMVISFLGVALTGLPLKFSSYRWAQGLAWLLGGFTYTGFWHRVFSITMFGCFGAYVLHLLYSYWRIRRLGETRLHTVFGPDSPVPNLRDVRDMGRMVKWFLGLGPRPTFERWAYWEKFDFFGAGSDIILIGTTGLILWFPNFFCRYLPGEVVNVAKVVHSTLALLATGFVFAIHFFGTHLRADKFPMDMSILTGVVTEEDMHHERPDLLERLQLEGREEELRATAPGPWKLFFIRVAGFVALFLGLAALAGIIWSLLV